MFGANQWIPHTRRDSGVFYFFPFLKTKGKKNNAFFFSAVWCLLEMNQGTPAVCMCSGAALCEKKPRRLSYR